MSNNLFSLLLLFECLSIEICSCCVTVLTLLLKTYQHQNKNAELQGQSLVT